MLFRETVAVYCENHTELTNTLSGQDAELLYVKACGTYSYHRVSPLPCSARFVPWTLGAQSHRCGRPLQTDFSVSSADTPGRGEGLGHKAAPVRNAQCQERRFSRMIGGEQKVTSGQT
jgi:hypothetical protein